MSDVKINTRSPYYIEANRVAPDPVVIPPPVEENTPPTVSITASNTNPCLTETVTLTAVATDTDGTIVSYLWGGTASPYTTSSITITNSVEESKTFYVIVTDDDGDTANASITIHWKNCTTQLPNQDIGVSCGDTFNQAQFVGTQGYNFFDIGNKIGDVTINFQDTIYSPNEVPIKFDLTWNGTTVSTGFIGSDSFDTELQNLGASVSDINTSSPTNKTTGTSLTITKSAASPSEVTLTATALIPNDSYTFELVCPDVLATTTYYYTLTGTCVSGDTEFTYLDVNGDTQTVVLAKDATQLISAQENSVSVAVCTGTTEKGGESFDLGKPDQDFDKNVEINIIFDDSGSMGGTLVPLQEMAQGNLKEKLLAYYDNDPVLYDDRVNVYKAGEFISTYITPGEIPGANTKERFMYIASEGKTKSDSTKAIYIFFQDEAQSTLAYQVSSSNSSYDSSSDLYKSDLANFKSFLNSITYGEFFMKFFIVKSNTPKYTEFLQNIFSGNNGFEGSKGLSDRSEVTSVGVLNEGVKYSDNPTYYYNYVIQALQDYGFNI